MNTYHLHDAYSFPEADLEHHRVFTLLELLEEFNLGWPRLDLIKHEDYMKLATGVLQRLKEICVFG